MESMTEFFAEYKSIIIIVHALGAALGVGAATISDILFFQFLKDGSITKQESPTLQVLTKVVWVALGILILSGIALFLSDPVKYLHSSKFIVKMFIVLMLTLNGLFITLVMHKKMHHISFVTKQHRRFKKIGFASGAISIVSWYISFILGSIRSIPLESTSGIGIYLGIVVIAIITSQFLYHKFKRRYQKDLSLEI